MNLMILIKQGLSTFFALLLRYPKEMIILLMGIYIIFCQLTHNGPLTINGKCQIPERGDTISDNVIEITTFDSAITILNVSEPIPVFEELPVLNKWKRPVPSSNASDSVDDMSSSLRRYEFSLTECEERIKDLSTIRTYMDSVRDETMVIYYEFKTQGKLEGAPKLSYKRIAPIISTERTVETAIPIGPYRKIGMGGELEYHNMGSSPHFRGMETSAMVSYMDLKNNQFIIKGGYLFQNQPGWTLGVGYIKNFNIKW